MPFLARGHLPESNGRVRVGASRGTSIRRKGETHEKKLPGFALLGGHETDEFLPCRCSVNADHIVVTGKRDKLPARRQTWRRGPRSLAGGEFLAHSRSHV